MKIANKNLYDLLKVEKLSKKKTKKKTKKQQQPKQEMVMLKAMVALLKGPICCDAMPYY